MAAAYIHPVRLILKFLTEILVDLQIFLMKAPNGDIPRRVLRIFCRKVSASLINRHQDDDHARILSLNGLHNTRDDLLVLSQGAVMVQMITTCVGVHK